MLLVAPDTYICRDCDGEKKPVLVDGPAPWHELDHHLIHIHDSAAPIELPTTSEKLDELEKKLVNLESKVEDRIASLESKVENRLAAMETLLLKISTQIMESLAK